MVRVRRRAPVTPTATREGPLSLRRRWLPILLSGLFVVLMVAASDLLGSTEVLFPEMTAILCGAWMQPRQAWNVDRPRMLLLMSAGALFGTAVNLLCPWPLWLRAPLGFLFCAAMMNAVGADMTPMLSAAILPMVLGTTSWVYPVAVTVLVTLVCLGQVGLERAGLREPIDYRVRRDPPAVALAGWGRRFVVFCLLACPAYATGNPFLAVPPLLVAYTELTRPDMTLRLRPVHAWGALALAAAIGSLARNAVVSHGVPVELAAACAFAALVLAWDLLKTWLPPAGAVVLLALLAPWPNPWQYAVQVAVAAAVWVAAAMLLFDGIRSGRDGAPGEG